VFNDYKNSLDLIELEQQNLEVARQNIDIALERYKLGVATPLELREVQRNAVATESRLIEAEYRAKVAEIELLRLSSRILQ
jgi:outer membrane protein TolC